MDVALLARGPTFKGLEDPQEIFQVSAVFWGLWGLGYEGFRAFGFQG